MKAIRFDTTGLKLADVPTPASGDEALIRVTTSGICSTDLEIIRGYAQFHGTLGHEFVGVVEEAEAAPQLVGKRVVGEINAGCGTCKLCLAGDPRHCPGRTVLGIKGRDGAHAEYLSLPARNLITVPDGVSDHQAVFAEPLAAAYGIIEQVDILPTTRVAVIGDGKLGILCAMTAHLRSKNTTLIGKHSSKLDIAGKRGISTMFVNETAAFNNAFDVVIEASGSESGFATALDLVRPRGKIVLKSTFLGMPKWEAWRVVVDELTIVGSRCGRFEPVMALLADGTLDLSDLISHEFALSDGIAAIDEAGKAGVMKVLLKMP